MSGYLLLIFILRFLMSNRPKASVFSEPLAGEPGCVEGRESTTLCAIPLPAHVFLRNRKVIPTCGACSFARRSAIDVALIDAVQLVVPDEPLPLSVDQSPTASNGVPVRPVLSKRWKPLEGDALCASPSIFIRGGPDYPRRVLVDVNARTYLGNLGGATALLSRNHTSGLKLFLTMTTGSAFAFSRAGSFCSRPKRVP